MTSPHGPEGPGTEHQPAGSITRDQDPSLPLDLLAGYGARVLDPRDAERIEGQETLRSTAYVADRLLVRSGAEEQSLELVREAAAKFGLETRMDPESSQLPHSGYLLRFRARPHEPVPPPDAWKVLQWARSFGRRRGAESALTEIGLDHLMFASVGVIRRRRPMASQAQLEAVSATSPSTVSEEEAISDYGRPGSGGRQPVAWLGPPPARHHDDELPGRRPVVAILDNGCGRHPWLANVVRPEPMLGYDVIGHSEPDTNPEVWSVDGLPLDDSVDAVAGHGTFMAGLVHMFCPDASVVAVRVVEPDGVALESHVVLTLAQIAEVVRRHRNGEQGGFPVDVLIMSMGYYHETSTEAAHSALAEVLAFLGTLGVIVVAAAGNDATSRPMYPAAFAASSAGSTSTSSVPVVSVGANNPDGSAAMFSNSGPWVKSWQPGASLVSTMPTTFRGTGTRSAGVASSGERQPVDPDDFRTGFAVWSGTSFAAPVLGGQLAASLLADAGSGALHDEAGLSAAVAGARQALSHCVNTRPS
jgi:hypothetical protein